MGMTFISESETNSVLGVGIALGVILTVTVMFCIAVSKLLGQVFKTSLA